MLVKSRNVEKVNRTNSLKLVSSNSLITKSILPQPTNLIYALTRVVLIPASRLKKKKKQNLIVFSISGAIATDLYFFFPIGQILSSFFNV